MLTVGVEALDLSVDVDRQVRQSPVAESILTLDECVGLASELGEAVESTVRAATAVPELDVYLYLRGSPPPLNVLYCVYLD